MVARIVSGKSIRGILNYNENKVRNADAEVLMACGFPRSHEELSFKNKLERFQMLTRQNERTRTNALHISLNFSSRDKLDAILLKKIALEYMEGIGFGNQPFLVYQHFDAAHPHIHLATVNIADGGQRIQTHNIGRIQSEKARKAIEERYGLIRAEDQKKEAHFLLRPANLKKALYGKSETKAAISSIVRSVVSHYKFTSLPELNAALRQFNVTADRGEEGSRMYEKRGLVYQLLDSNGNKTGVPIKASAIYDKPTLANLEKLYASNETARKPYGQRLKYLLDKALSCATEKECIDTLEKQQVRLLFRENSHGTIYGVTFIDNATGAVFNGSSLGKAYSAKAFIAHLPRETQLEDAVLTPQTQGNEENEGVMLPEAYLHFGGNVIEKITDILLPSTTEYEEPNPLLRKKRKRQQLTQT